MADPIKITITIDENGVSCDAGTDLSPEILVFWLEAVKKIVLEDSLAPAPPEAS